MTPAAHANEYAANIGPDLSLSDAYDAEYLEVEEEDDAERQRRNVAYGEWLGMY